MIDALHESHGVTSHRHAVHPGAGLGGDAGPARAAAVIGETRSPAGPQELAAARAPFVVATVVRVAAARERGARQRRARAGRRHDRRVHRRPLRPAQRPPPRARGDRERRAAAAADRPRRPRRSRSARRAAVTVTNHCLSGGAIEVFLEPVLPAPRVLVAGDSPIVAALRALGRRRRARDRRGAGHHGRRARAERGRPRARGRGATATDEVATLRAGLEAGVRYVGPRGEPKARRRGDRGAARRGRRGRAAGERLETPAGLDIGARTPAEVALSIVARIVEVRRAGHQSEERSELARRDR